MSSLVGFLLIFVHLSNYFTYIYIYSLFTLQFLKYCVPNSYTVLEINSYTVILFLILISQDLFPIWALIRAQNSKIYRFINEQYYSRYKLKWNRNVLRLLSLTYFSIPKLLFINFYIGFIEEIWVLNILLQCEFSATIFKLVEMRWIF